MFGSAIFEQPKKYDPGGMNHGYKCLSGQLPERIFGTGELPSNVKWLTNISVDQAFNLQLRNTPRILDDKYLRTAASSIILELGLKHAAFETQASVVAKIFSNVMSLAKVYFSLNDTPAGSLAAGLPGFIGHHQPLITDRRIGDASSQAIHQFSHCERMQDGSGRVEYISVVLPRIQHAKHVLDSGLPFDDFEFIPNSKMPPEPNRLSWVLRSDLPILAKVRIPRIEKSWNPLINWGNGAGLIKKQNVNSFNGRDYATSNELRVLSNFSEIIVDEIAISNTPIENRYSLPAINRLSETSYSYGLLCENIWCSLARDKGGQYVRSPMTAWLHATDRMECLKYAFEFSRAGFIVNGYGYGRITLAIREEQKSDFRKFAFKLGLFPYLEPGMDCELSSEASPEQIFKTLFQSGLRDELIYLDNAFVSQLSD